MDCRAVYSIARKEFMDNWRNKWIMAVSAIFLILTLVISYFGSMGAEGTGWRDLDVTIMGMIMLVTLLVPIIGLMLGYATIVGEKERGSLELLLSYPVGRIEVLAGKFLGLGAVLSVANFAGFGVAGVVIGVNVRGVQWGNYIMFILASILLGLVFISVSMFFSSIFKKRSTAMGAAVFLWFLFEMIWNIIIAGILTAQYGVGKVVDPNFMAPNWFYVASLINPVKAYSALVSLTIESVKNIAGNIPSFVNIPFTLTILFSWIIAAFVLTYYVFNKKDL
ncbi:MAG: ABC transporter permease [Candidatus Thermoplasmatota archaeon]|nr:ABC transporter permease [Candidatus Thermoplasmatota archaeon]